MHKTIPILIYNFSGGGVICLPITSNEDKKGNKLKEPSNYEVSIKLERYSLIKVNKTITINKNTLFKYFGIQK